MPNWCQNHLKISGNPEQVAELAAKIIRTGDGGRQEIDFNGILPMPESLLAESRYPYHNACFFRLPETTVLSEHGEKFSETHFALLQQHLSPLLDWPTATVAEITVLLNQDPGLQELCQIDCVHHNILQENIRLYGHADWWGWRIANWGTKWNGGECYGLAIEEDCLFADFDTAWSPPCGVYQAICAAYPDLSLEAYYMELGMWFAGRYVNNGSELLDEACSDEEVKNFCIGHFGMEFDDEDEND